VTKPRVFEVISADDHGAPTRCSYCAEHGSVVVLPLTGRPGLEERFAESDGELWMGLCLRCVDGMRAALRVGVPS
jgi:hypothetical protein